MSFPLDTVRARFPALAQDLVFFDNPGGTQVHGSVIEAVGDYWRESCANVGGAFATSQRTDRTVAGARAAMADLLGAPDPECLVFGPSMTALTFHIARSLIETLTPGDEIVVTELDHNANVAPWRDAEAVGVRVVTAPLRAADGTLETEAVLAAIRPGKTKLVAVTQASNALGTVPDLTPIVGAAHDAGARVYVDGVQSVPHLPTDVAALGCDFLACSAYKFFGPHVGVLYGRRDALESLTPHKVRPAKDTIPHRWEQGTLNHEGLAGVSAAVAYLESLGEGASRRERLVGAMTAIRDVERGLSVRLLETLARTPGVRLYGIADPARVAERVPTVAFTLDGHTPRAVCEGLAERGICAWSGNYYAVTVMEALGLESGAVRVGLCHYNTAEEIGRLGDALRAIR